MSGVIVAALVVLWLLALDFCSRRLLAARNKQKRQSAPRSQRRPAAKDLGRGRTAADSPRYDQITRKMARTRRFDPGDFTSTLDYLRWSERCAETWVYIPDGIYAEMHMPGATMSAGNYEAVERLRGR